MTQKNLSNGKVTDADADYLSNRYGNLFGLGWTNPVRTHTELPLDTFDGSAADCIDDRPVADEMSELEFTSRFVDDEELLNDPQLAMLFARMEARRQAGIKARQAIDGYPTDRPMIDWLFARMENLRRRTRVQIQQTRITAQIPHVTALITALQAVLGEGFEVYAVVDPEGFTLYIERVYAFVPVVCRICGGVVWIEL